jgi:osmotically-inducible protein OsmY
MNTKGGNRKLGIMAVLVFCVFALKPLVVCAADRPDDDTITRFVKEALQQDPRVMASEIQVSTEKGIVRLSGTAWNLADKRFADREAKKINGVRGVIDEIMVEPAYRPDTDILQDVRRRLIDSSAIQSPGVGIIVLDGEVTLDGTVASWTEMRQADLLASEVMGVKAVRNHMAIETPRKRSDKQIRKDIEATIQRDVYLADLPIEVSVDKGIVFLKGKVGNAYQKERAWEDAWIDGVTSVKNQTTVEGWEEQGVRRNHPAPTAQQLEQSVRDELYQDLRIEDPFKINVDASHGEITLRGKVPTYHQKRIAERDARDVVGVWWVNNLLNVHVNRRTDKAIAYDLNFELGTDYVLAGQDIQPHVKNGVVTLSGNVNSAFERDHAARVAADVLGVREVVDNITVHPYPRYSDAALIHRIDDRLAGNWETYRVADRIEVKVKDGKAILTGQVDNWAQYREAAAVTRLTDGVWALDNQLSVAAADYPWPG